MGANMMGWSSNQSLRALQILIGLGYFLLYLIVALNNFFDYNTNFQFVKSTMTMAQVASDNPLKYRSIQSGGLHHFIYLIIMLAEWVMAFLFAKGTFILFKGSKETNEVYHQLKGDLILAHGVSFFFWFLFFVVIAGEWFYMWRFLDTGKPMIFAASHLLAIVVLWLEDREKIEKVSTSHLIT